MNKIKALPSLLVSAALLAAAPTAPSAEELSETGLFLDGVAAIVNEGVVLKSELNRQTEMIVRNARKNEIQLPPPDVIQGQVLEKLIVEEIQLQRAERIGIQISDQTLNTAIANIAQNADIPFERLPEVLAADGISYADYRRDMRRQLILEQLRRIEVMQRISVSPREIEACIADIEDNVVVNSAYNLSHILVSVPDSATGEQFDEAEAEANEIYARLRDGASFAELAVRYSDASDTSLQGGSLGWRDGNQLPTIFFDVVGDMQAGDFSAPIRTVSGFHIVKVNEIRGVNQKSEVEQIKVRHILITPNEIIDDETAKQRLEDTVRRLEAGEEFGELAKLLSDDPGSQNEGGEMDWSSAGTFVPEFEQVANSLELGVVSEPFRSRFGWHILEVMDRRVYDNTEDLKQENCANRVRNSKLANETELWARRIRDEAFVETRI